MTSFAPLSASPMLRSGPKAVFAGRRTASKAPLAVRLAAHSSLSTQRLPSRAARHAVAPLVQATSSAAARGAVAPWLPPPAKDGSTSKLAAAGRLLVAASTYISLPLELAAFACLFWCQASLAALLGSQTQVLLLMAAPLVLAYASGGGVLQHEYEGFQLSKVHDWGATATKEYRTNRWLRELTARQYSIGFSWAFICIGAAAFGLTPAVLAVAAVSTLAFAGPYVPVLEPLVNGQPILMVSLWTMLGFGPTLVLLGMGLWKLLGAVGMLSVAHILAGVGLETAAEITNNEFVHTLAHTLQLTFFPVLAFLLTRAI